MIAVKVDSIIAEREEKFVSTTGTNIIPLKLNQIKNHFGELSTDNGVKSREPTLSEMEAYMSGVMAGSKTGLDKQIDGEETAKLVNF